MQFRHLITEDRAELQATTDAIVKDIGKLVWLDPKKGGVFGIIDRVIGVYPYKKSGVLYWGILLQANSTTTNIESKQAGQLLLARYQAQYPQHKFRLETNENAIKLLVNELQPTEIA